MDQGNIRIAAVGAEGIEIADARHADLLVAACLAAAAQGDTAAYYDLGVAYSTGSHGVGCDLVEQLACGGGIARMGAEQIAARRVDARSLRRGSRESGRGR